MRSEMSIPHVLWRRLPRRSDEAAAGSVLLPNWETSREQCEHFTTTCDWYTMGFPSSAGAVLPKRCFRLSASSRFWWRV